MDQGAFFTEIDDGVFDSSPLTAGPWSPDSQHGGPPSALLARQLEHHRPRAGHRLARVSIDLLAPVPVGRLHIGVESLRTGKRVELLQATAQAQDRTVAIARAWRVIAATEDFPTEADTEAESQAQATEPEITPQHIRMPHGMHTDGYLSAIDWSFVSGSFAEFGPAQAWARPRPALVAGEAMTPWQRVLAVVDSGSGISMSAPPDRYPAINCDVVAVLHRDPVGEWIGLDSHTLVTPGQGALARTTVFDAAGDAGLATQTLVV